MQDNLLFCRWRKVTSHSEIDTSLLAGRRQAEQATANMSCSKTLFSVNSVYILSVLQMAIASCLLIADASVKVHLALH